jgi:signal transduction histidine kinase
MLLIWREGQHATSREGEDTMQNAVSAVRRPRLPGQTWEDEPVVEGPDVREQALAMVGHDLRTPLHAIRLTLALLLRSAELPEDTCRNLERIDRAAGRMLEMIASLIDFSERRFTGAVRVVPVPADLHEICRCAIDELLATAPGRRIDLEIAGDVRGTWDPARLAQVVSNLVANSLKHGCGHRPVRVWLRGDDDEVLLSVHNGGPAIAPERLSAMFQPFRARSEARDSSHARGLGLGLYIVKAIVDAHGGAVAVRSSDQHGTVFTVILPRGTPAPTLEEGRMHA